MGLSKFLRRQHREHPVRTYGLIPAVSLLAAGGAVAATVAAGPVAVGLMIAGGIGLFASGISAIESDWPGGHEGQVNGKRLVGSPQDIFRVERVQKFIDGKTKKLKDRPELPLALRRKILAHAQDAAESLARLRVFEDHYSGKQAESFTFSRYCYDEKGQQVRQPIVIIDLKPHPALPAPEPAVIKALPAPQTLSLTFDDVKDRLERVEMAKLTGPEQAQPSGGLAPK